MSRLSSACARHTRLATTIPVAARTASTGAASRAPSGARPPATRMSPYVPSLSSTPASSTEPTVGAAVCAAGSHECSGHSGALTAKPSASRTNTSSETPSPTPPPAMIAPRSAVPASATATNRPVAMSSEPATVNSANLTAAARLVSSMP